MNFVVADTYPAHDHRSILAPLSAGLDIEARMQAPRNRIDLKFEDKRAPYGLVADPEHQKGVLARGTPMVTFRRDIVSRHGAMWLKQIDPVFELSSRPQFQTVQPRSNSPGRIASRNA